MAANPKPLRRHYRRYLRAANAELSRAQAMFPGLGRIAALVRLQVVKRARTDAFFDAADAASDAHEARMKALRDEDDRAACFVIDP